MSWAPVVWRWRVRAVLLDIEQVFDTLASMTEHLYVEYMFSERVFHVKYPSRERCHTPSTGLTP